jgi:hypothetical protein
MPHVRTLPAIEFPLLGAIVILAAALAIVSLSSQGSSSSSSFDERCESWDAAASAVVAGMVGDRSTLAEAQLGDALFRLKRARKHCRYGFIALARLDYDALMGDRSNFRR